MLFSSNIFIFLYLPVALVGYQLFSGLGRRALLAWLVLISLFFYGFWNPIYLLLLVGSMLANFLFSIAVGNRSLSEASRKRWLVGAIAANLLCLMWFKYLFPTLAFFHDTGWFARDFGQVVLPLGISFFTFTQIAYLIDVQQGIATRESLLSYSVFVTFFPHLIAGPIIHPREVMPQLEEGRIGKLRIYDVTLGFTWFVLGLSKKVLIADRIAPLPDAVFEHPSSYGFIATWLGVLGYAIQLYFDFSGYSDMALGLARMFSIKFPINFDSPYKAASIIDFWQRWHMTLTRYLGEYLYTPILRAVNGRRMDQGKKVSRKAQATLEGFIPMVFFPLMTTMFLAGIWHGAGMQFIIFGVLHGLFLTINHAWRLFTPKGHPLHGKLPFTASVLLTFFAVLSAQIFFRANSVPDAGRVISTLTGLHGLGSPYTSSVVLTHLVNTSGFLRKPGSASLGLAVCLLIAWFTPNTQEILNQLSHDSVPWPSLIPRFIWKPTFLWSMAITALFAISILMLDANTSFLYFQF